MTEKPRGRFQSTWDELESSAHVPADQMVELQDVGVLDAPATAEELDRQKAMGTMGDARLSR